jgi:UDP-glucose 6-dehydrogenase
LAASKEVVAVVGLGYVGLPTAACFASRGFRAIGIDTDDKKVRALKSGKTQLYDRGFPELFRRGLEEGSLSFTSDYESALADAATVFITVGTPSLRNGSIDLSQVRAAATSIGRVLRNQKGYRLVVVKSTVAPGTTRNVVGPTIEKHSGKRLGEYGLAANPEFLREGDAVGGTLSPDRVVIGADDRESKSRLKALYNRFYAGHLPRMLLTNTVNAEMIKYASNAFLATKVSFMNEIARLCSATPGADVTVVSEGMGLDSRIGPRHLRAGLGFGGSCLPPSEKVQTFDGLKQIGEIFPGEQVLAHDGRYHSVTRIYSRNFNGNLVEIHGRGFNSFPIVCTPEHPILVGKRGFTGASPWYNNNGRNKLKNATKFDEPEFLPASKIEHGDVIYLPEPVPISPKIPVMPYAAVYKRRRQPMIASVEVTPELQYLFGIYLAEGSMWDDNIYWSLHKKESDIVEELDTITTKYFGHRTKVKSRPGNGLRAETSSKPLAAYLESTFGRLAWRKRIPHEWAICLPEDHLVQLLRGMIRGDGSSSDGRYEFTTTSETLWNFMQVCLLRLRIPFAVHTLAGRIDAHGVHHRNSFTIRVTDIDAMNRIIHDAQRIERKRKKYNVSGFHGGYFAFPVRRVSQIPYSGEVRNLEVDGANSYVVQGGIVHNCFPKDVRAIIAAARASGVQLPIIEAANQTNERQPLVAVQMARQMIGELRGKRVALLGLSFKPDTDDMREAVSIRLVNELRKRGSRVVVYDPVATPNARRIFGRKVEYAESVESCVKDADCCIVVTEWDEFRRLRPKDFSPMRIKALVDGRRIFNPSRFNKKMKFAAVGYGKNP